MHTLALPPDQEGRNPGREQTAGSPIWRPCRQGLLSNNPYGMGISPRAVAEDIGDHHTPVAGERLVRRADSMDDKNLFRLVSDVVLVPLFEPPPANVSY